jgi:RNA polymerase-binding transcription factor DksA
MPTHITDDQLAALKQQLLEEQAHLQHERDAYRSDDMSDTEEGETGDLSHVDPNDPADEASNLFDRDRNQATVENADRVLGKIARALQKMDEGSYGLSDVDGTPIPLARLQALPYAVTTVEQEEQAL